MSKRKILWLCNTMLPELFRRFDIRYSKEGWLIGISNELRKQSNIELHYVCPQSKEHKIVNTQKDGINFHCFYAQYNDLYTVKEEVRVQIRQIVDNVQPDIIHIFGTEMPHTIACVDCVKDKEKIVISIQGLVSEYRKHYLDGIPFKAYLTGGMAEGRYQTIYSQFNEFVKRTENEVSAIKKIKYVIGRTDWDKAFVHKINKNCRYFYCSETLRDSFYNNKWEIKDIERYSIYVSQGNYPIKGLHNLLEALPDVIRKFPETKVYVAGVSDFINEGFPYGKYIDRLIKKNGLGQYISFLGTLGEKEVCRRLLKAHVAVMPSNIENSPNSIGEAMALGTPVVASFVGGIPSIIQHRKEGILYQHGCNEMLSYSICQVFESDSLAEYLSENARKRAKITYNRENNLRQLLDIYERVDSKNVCK